MRRSNVSEEMSVQTERGDEGVLRKQAMLIG
jgi:hypothetical protein